MIIPRKSLLTGHLVRNKLNNNQHSTLYLNMRPSLYGCIKIAPVSCRTLFAVSSLDCIVASDQITRPPYRFTFSTLQVGAFFGITMYAGMPRSFAAKANAAAWFPLILENTSQESYEFTESD